MARATCLSALLASLFTFRVLAGLSGVVLDPSGANVSAARLTLATSSQANVATSTSNSEGRFDLPAQPGSYILSVSKTGFADFRAAVAVTSANQDFTVRLSLTPMASEVTVSAETSRVLEIANSPQPVTLISAQTLAQRGQVLSDAADGETGVSQLRTSSTLGSFFVRGLTGKNVAVFRDGVRYTTSAQRGGIATFLNLLNPDSIDGVEILRGPSSAQYGSDSLGGAISVLSRPIGYTPNAKAWHAEASTLYQSFANAYGSTLALNYGGPRFGFSSDLAARRFNTFRTAGGLDSHAAVTRFLGLPSNLFGNRLPDTAFTAYGGSFHSQYRFNDNSFLIGHYERSQQDGGKRYDQLLGGDGNWIADLRNLMLDFGYLRYQHLQPGPFDQLSITSSYNAQREERVNQGGQGNPLGAVTHQYEKTKAWGLQFFLNKHHKHLDWLIGGEGYFEKIAAPSFTWNPVNNAVALVRPRVPDGARYLQHGLYSQATWLPFKTNRLRIAGALRYGGASFSSRASNSPLVAGKPLWPNDSLSANAFSGRVGAVVWATSSLAFHANYSRGFRVPNVTDLSTLGLQGNGAFEAAVADLAGRNATIGDRADDQARSTGLATERLRPEFSNNFDFGLRFRHARLQAELTSFFLNLDNTIISQTLILPQGVTGQTLGDQIISRQLASGAVFVPISTAPVLVRANFSGARTHGIEHSLRYNISRAWSIGENLTYVYAEDSRTGLPPDLEPGVPPLTINPTLAFRPSRGKFWFELYGMIAGRQDRLSSLALSDRRIGNPRSRANIQSFFNNGARTRGLVANGILIPTGETLAQVQNRVLGSLNSAPQFSAIPGFGTAGLRGGWNLGEKTSLFADFSNLADKSYRGIGWGLDGPGRAISLRLRHRF